jgi:hypothetical protein
MWADAYAKILEQGDLAHIALLLLVGLLTAGMVTLWRAWRKDAAHYHDSIERLRELLLLIKGRLKL